MAKEIEHFHYQRYIPEEKRGGSYSAHVNTDGKITGPFTPQQLDEQGLHLSDIFADIDRQMALRIEQLESELNTVSKELASAAESVNANAEVVAQANAVLIKSKAAIDGANAIIEKAGALLDDEGRAAIAGDIEALNATLKGGVVET